MTKKPTKNYGETLRTTDMRVTPDEEWILVGGRRFKRVCLPSPMEARAMRAAEKEEEALLTEFAEDENV